MRTIHILPLCVGIVLLCSQSGSWSQSKPITEADSVIAIYTEDWGLFSSGGPKLLVSVWSDGHIVWSNNQIRGGPPYHQGSVEPAKVDGLLSRLERDKVFTNKKLSRANFGPDSKFTVIFVKKGKRVLKMQSWHELNEEGGNLLNTDDGGLVPLDGRKREDVLKLEPQDYQDYRATWEGIRKLVQGLLPAKSTPSGGILRMKAGIVTWEEKAKQP